MDRRRPALDIAPTGMFVPPTVWSGGNAVWGPGEAPRLAQDSDLLITFGFRCNLACTFCIAEDGMDTLRGISPQTFESWLQRPEMFRGVTRISLSGGEATLEPELVEYVQIARRVPGIQHVRLQTNAMRLADRAYLQRLIDLGVDEFFVSMHGWDEPSTAAITVRKGAFKGIMAGVEAIAASSATLFTNTCMIPDNYQHLVEIVELVAPYKPAQVSMWNQFPRLDTPQRRHLMVRVGALQPHLLRALDRCDELGISAQVKWFPRCLLGKHMDKQNDDQPTTVVEPDFWPNVPQFSCIFSTACVHGHNGCGGLSHPYIDEFGWEEELLPPIPNDRPLERGKPELPLSPADDRRTEVLLRDTGVAELLQAHGWKLDRWTRRFDPNQKERDTLRLLLSRPADGEQRATAWLDLSPDLQAKGAVKSASLVVSHGRVEGGDEAPLRELLLALRQELPKRDPGGLKMPWVAQRPGVGQ